MNSRKKKQLKRCRLIDRFLALHERFPFVI
jgi:hypothetical protein